ncbi:MAG: phosphate ABC transporter ATP-binding protein [Thermoplasmata archaeon]|nr:MAG: phosphate ABC transporter ATP-binding protein [Thermoplasmata archaeon]
MEIELKGVSKNFNGKKALSNIDLKVGPGKIIAIIGPSGSGKTTLLRIINLLDLPLHGTLALDGKDAVKLTNGERHELRKRMALVFQNPSLFQRTVKDNVAYGLKIRYMHPEIIEKEVQKALKLIGLDELKYQFAPTLSAGEAQRVSFARAIVFRPELLLLDEFTANLDPANVRLLEESVVNFHAKTNATIVLATHNLFQARRLAHEVVFIYDGRIVEYGEKEAFFSHPHHQLTRSFLSGELVY